MNTAINGFILVPKHLFSDPTFSWGDSPYDRLAAFLWLVKEACWVDNKPHPGKPEVALQRGELGHSLRFMAKAWKWELPAVRRFLKRLESADYIQVRICKQRTIVLIKQYEQFQALKGGGAKRQVGTRLGDQAAQDHSLNGHSEPVASRQNKLTNQSFDLNHSSYNKNTDTRGTNRQAHEPRPPDTNVDQKNHNLDQRSLLPSTVTASASASRAHTHERARGGIEEDKIDYAEVVVAAHADSADKHWPDLAPHAQAPRDYVIARKFLDYGSRKGLPEAQTLKVLKSIFNGRHARAAKSGHEPAYTIKLYQNDLIVAIAELRSPILDRDDRAKLSVGLEAESDFPHAGLALGKRAEPSDEHELDADTTFEDEEPPY